MRTSSVARCLVFALFLLAVSSASFAQIGIYVSFGPPPIPVYDQPICPEDGYVWIPGYWAWDGNEYYWVPGTWAPPPAVDLLWTPGYWEWGVNGFFFHEGYWGPLVGWYGGVNYGFGYFGHGYEGGRWDREHFFYNRAVNNIDFNRIHNIYENREFYRNTNRVSYNGGPGGISARPSAGELAFSRERHYGPTTAQTQHMQAARNDRDLRGSVNFGKPSVAATQRPGKLSDHTVPGRATGGTWQPPGNREANPPRPVMHPNDLPPLERSYPPYTGSTKLDQKYQQQQEKVYNKQVQERQKLQQRQDREVQKLTQQNASATKMQKMNQRHQQQTQQMQQREVRQRQQVQQKEQKQKSRQ